jgi:hypothetical protein
MVSFPLRCLRFALGFIACIVLLVELDPRSQVKIPGQVDLLEYWAAAKLIAVSDNPYDAARIAEIQLSEPTTGSTIPAPILMWNPPLVVPFIAFMGELDFDDSRVIWSIMTMLAGFVSIVLLVSIEKFSVNWRLLLSLVTFFPLMSVLQFGQISWVLILSLALALYFLKKGQHLLVGLSLSLFLVKPHLFYLGYLSFFVLAPGHDRVRFILGFLSGGVFLGGLAEVIAPGVWAQWIQAFGKPPTDFLTPTLGSVLQGILSVRSDLILYLPAAFSLFLIAVFRNSYLCRNILKDPVAIAALSLATAPYGWVFDQIVLMPLVFRLATAKEKALSYAVLALNILGFSVWFPALHHYWWYPVALFILAIIDLRSRVTCTAVNK